MPFSHPSRPLSRIETKRSHRSRLRCLDFLESRLLLSTVYVDVASPFANPDGTSWPSAFHDLQQALTSAHAGDQVDVAAGYYTPIGTFQLSDGVTLRGGFAGNANPANPGLRDLATYKTFLLGAFGATTPVLTLSNVSSSTLLDGVIVQGGGGSNGAGVNILNSSPIIENSTFQSSTASHGGAMYILNGSPTLQNCLFRNNSADFGNAIYDEHANLTITGCTFSNNQHEGDNSSPTGGAIYNANSTVSIADSNFTFNLAATGGAMYNTASTVNVTRSFFDGNQALSISSDNDLAETVDGDGGAIVNEANSPFTAINSVFADNAGGFGGALFGDNITLINCTLNSNAGSSGRAIHSNQFPASDSILNCILWGPSTSQAADFGLTTMNITYSDIHGGYPGTGNIDATPQFMRDTGKGPDNSWNTSDDDYGDLRLSQASSAIDAGNNAGLPAGITTDLAGDPRRSDDPIVPDTGTGAAPVVDMGAYELYFPSSTTNKGPTALSLTLHLNNLKKSAPVGAVIGTLVGTDPDAGSKLSYSLVPGSNDNASFRIAGNRLQLRTRIATSPKTLYNVHVRVRDQAGLSFDRTFAIHFSTTDHPPTKIQLASPYTSGRRIFRTLAAHALVGTFSATDPDPTDKKATFSFQLVTGPGSNNNNLFFIRSNRLLLGKSPVMLGHDHYKIRVRVTDPAGLSREQTFAL